MNAEPGNHKERNDGVKTRPKQNAFQRLRKDAFDRILAQRKSKMGMVQKHGKDAQATQHVDAGEATLNWYFVFQIGWGIHSELGFQAAGASYPGIAV